MKEEIVINPKYVDAYFELANIYFKRNDLNQLVYYLEKSKELRPKDPMINNNLLLTYINLKQKKKAEDLVNFMNMNGLSIPQKLIDDIKAL